MIKQYGEYLVCTIGNYTSSNLAEHLDEVSHDVITDYFSNERHTARGLWELISGLIQDSSEAFMLLDDSVQNKRYSQFIELVKLQSSGAAHGLVRGIGIVNLVHSAGGEKRWQLQAAIFLKSLPNCLKAPQGHWQNYFYFGKALK